MRSARSAQQQPAEAETADEHRQHRRRRRALRRRRSAGPRSEATWYSQSAQASRTPGRGHHRPVASSDHRSDCRIRRRGHALPHPLRSRDDVTCESFQTVSTSRSQCRGCGIRTRARRNRKATPGRLKKALTAELERRSRCASLATPTTFQPVHRVEQHVGVQDAGGSRRRGRAEAAHAVLADLRRQPGACQLPIP